MKNITIQQHIQMAAKISHIFDEKFSIFGFRFGIDPLLGLFPGLGDSFSLLFSLYILWIAYKLRVPFKMSMKMIRNIGIDYIIGLVPLVGDVADFYYKANVKNMELLREYLRTAGINDVLIK